MLSRRASFFTLGLLLVAIAIVTIPQQARADYPACSGYLCEPSTVTSDILSILRARPLMRNARGSSPITPKQGGLTLSSASHDYAIPILGLPGRGLSLNLTLHYNSRIWAVDQNKTEITFNADRDFPSYGFRLNFGYIEGPFTNDLGTQSYLLTESDGHKCELRQSGALFESYDSDYTDFNASTLIVRRKNGTQLQYEQFGNDPIYRPIEIKGTNGNYITIAYDSQVAQKITTITDTMGRVITFNYNTDGTLADITGPDFGAPPPSSGGGKGGGKKNLTDRFAKGGNGGGGGGTDPVKTYATFAWTTTTLTYNFINLTVNAPSQGSTHTVLESVTLPNNTSYVFTYGDWGEVIRITTKSSTGLDRGYVRYYFVGTDPLYYPAQSDAPAPGTKYLWDGVNPEGWWALNFTRDTQGEINQIDVTEDDGTNVRTNRFQSGWEKGLVSTVAVSKATTYKTTTNQWIQDNTGVSYRTNPRLTGQTTSTEAGNASTSYLYGTYGNPTQTDVRDYDGTLLRRTDLTYLTTSAYTDRHILDRVAMETVYGIGRVARTEYSYDSTALTLVTGATHHDDANYDATLTARGNLTAVTRYTTVTSFQISGPITEYSYYDTLGNLIRKEGACCATQEWSYTSATQYAYPETISRGTTPQLVSSSTYDYSTGLLTSTTDPNGQVTGFEFDSMHRQTGVTRPDGTQITTAYNDASQRDTVTVTSPINGANSRVQVTTLDGFGRTIKQEVRSLSGTVFSIVDTQYNSEGRVASVTNPYKSGETVYSTQYQYDQQGRVTKIIPPGGSPTSNNISYSYSVNSVTQTDQGGKQTRTFSNVLGQVVRVEELGNPNPLLPPFTVATTYTYHALGGLSATNIDGWQNRTFNYDGLGRIKARTNPESGTVTYTYHPSGQVATRTDARGVATTYTYDSLKRLTGISYSVPPGVAATSPVTFYYDEGGAAANALGRVTRMVDGSGEERYTYNLLGQIAGVTKIIGTRTYVIQYAYNQAGQITSVTYPSGRVVTYTLDAIGRLNQVALGSTTLLSNASYNGAGAPTGFSYGNGVAATFTYSNRLQLASLRYAKGATNLFYLTYDYNATHEQPNGTNATGNNGQIGRINDLVDTGRSTTYTYDYRGRLKTGRSDGFSPEGIYNNWGLSFVYDRYGNRTSQNVTWGSGPSSQLSFDPNNNRITSAGYSYDASGNLTQDPMGSSVFDGESRLTSPASSPFPVTYTFDAHNQRVKKFAWNTTYEYIYSKALGNKLLALYINGGLSREYVYVGGTLIATRLSNGVIQYHHSDHLEVRVTSDGSGSVIGYQGHYPFGESWYSNNAPFYNYRFTSYGWDSNVSQLYYASNRFYNYQIGRFQTPDLLDLTSTCSGPGVGHRLLNPSPREANLYPYVINDPTNRVDPLGLFGADCTPWPGFPPTDEPPFPIPGRTPSPIPGFTPPPTLPGNDPIPTFCPLDPFEGDPVSDWFNALPDNCPWGLYLSCLVCRGACWGAYALEIAKCLGSARGFGGLAYKLCVVRAREKYWLCYSGCYCPCEEPERN